MEGQISIFELLPPEERPIEEMSSEDIARIIGQAIGLKFLPSEWFDEMRAKPYKNLEFTVRKSFYSCDTVNNKKGDAFIGCGYSFGTSGAGSPVDSIEDAIKFFERALERAKEGQHGNS